MHELSLCDDLLGQVLALGRQHQARSIVGITVHVGGLSGVEPMLLATAFEICRVGTLAEQARLVLEPIPVRVHCNHCGIESETPNNHLQCPVCQSPDTDMVSGDELILARVELDTACV
ncbi:MAG: hydrogenase maturation nickel metallochaperone HypA [Gammaproteobacteria bacterium HGW-Gammaproteobacteria-3]|nr:MAG: hydrogenase maturation nickel metallochaperone HypA [Gammaproteobacteria bacterium HGW-Gammaproteobacteria-3]